MALHSSGCVRSVLIAGSCAAWWKQDAGAHTACVRRRGPRARYTERPARARCSGLTRENSGCSLVQGHLRLQGGLGAQSLKPFEVPRRSPQHGPVSTPLQGSGATRAALGPVSAGIGVASLAGGGRRRPRAGQWRGQPCVWIEDFGQGGRACDRRVIPRQLGGVHRQLDAGKTRETAFLGNDVPWKRK